METKPLDSRREFLLLYDIKMGNPNGDPDENRPRVLPDGTFYVTDVRLKRFVRDFLKTTGHDILVDTIEGKTTNLTGRVAHYLQTNKLPIAEGSEIVRILLDSFIDARLFGSSFAFKKAEKVLGREGKEEKWEPKPEPKTMTGAVQINMGEVLHQAEEVEISGTSLFARDEEKTQGTFTSYHALRYALIGFSGVANEHSASISRLTNNDYEAFLQALWFGVRSAGNTRTKLGQIPRLLLSIDYQPGEEFQVGRLHDYVKLIPVNAKPEKIWASPSDYRVDLQQIINLLEKNKDRIRRIRLALSDDLRVNQDLPASWEPFQIENTWKPILNSEL